MMTKLVIASLALVFLAGCASWRDNVSKLNPIDAISPHRVEIPQGNVLTQEQVSLLKPGMTPAQVRFLLGTPLLVDPFHSNRWDYAYLLQRGGTVIEHRHITVLFENDKLARIEGDVVAAKPAQPAEAAPAQPAPATEAAKPAEAAKP